MSAVNCIVTMWRRAIVLRSPEQRGKLIIKRFSVGYLTLLCRLFLLVTGARELSASFYEVHNI